MLRTRRSWLVLAGLLALVAVAAGVEHEHRAVQAWNPRNLMRLHVVAHSDSSADQEAKLAVRDAILRHFRGRLPATPAAASAVIQGELEQLDALARGVLRERHLEYEARAEWGVFAFPERAYGGRVAPSGNYRAVRVVLGSGMGENWWCVLFPPLCFLELTADSPPEEVSARLEEAPVEVRLWFWERAQQLARRWPALSRWLARRPMGAGPRD
ncbi:MAG: stage II sporulation protein R [bacterium]|nr:stage II sporulation protein R [bacterium]